MLGTIGLAGALIALAARIYTDVLWFRELGHPDVFWTTLKWRLFAAGIVGLGTTCFLLLNFAVVDWVMASRTRVATVPEPVAALWRARRLIYPLVAIAGGAISIARRQTVSWQQLLLWVHRSDFGQKDPVFHRDVGFFVFSLPVYREVSVWLLETAAMASIATVVAYAAAGGLGLARPLAMARAARAHLLLLGALMLLVVAWRLRLEQFGLVVPREGTVLPGAAFTDARVRLPLLRVLTGLALVGSAATAFAAARRPPVRGLAVAAALTIVALAAMSRLPPIVQRFAVTPQQLTRERPYLVKAIESTQQAYDLDRVRVRALPTDQALSGPDLAENQTTLQNVPLWDAGVLKPAMDELESIGSYYRFGDPTVDRYTVGGVTQLMTVAARNLDLTRVEPSARGWSNKRFAYTHGYGAVAIRAGDADAEGFPSFGQREFGPWANPLRLRQPRIYYGVRRRSDPPYRIVPSRRGEVEQPTPGSRASEYHYDGSGGIRLSSLLRRATFAVRFHDFNLLLSRTVTDRSRILLHRDAHERLAKLAPFLRWDVTPQTAVIGGRVTYLFHGYSTSDTYPYSASIRLGRTRVNYIREAARAEVDAFNGHVTVYAADSADPILRAWQAAYPSLFLPASQMPPELRAHLRYPGELFAAQMKVYETYHADDPTAFWTGSDVWDQPLQLAGAVESAGEIRFPDPQRLVDSDERGEGAVTPNSWLFHPDYLLARLPGDLRTHFQLVMPFAPRGRHNIVAYLAGSIDSKGRPRLTLLSLPRDRLTVGPAQATRRILASPQLSKRLELLNRESRDLGKAAVLRTVLGVPHVVPVGDQLVHVQPVYLAAGGDGVPRLQLVAVHANGRVGYGPNVTAALRQVLRAAGRDKGSAAADAPTRGRPAQAP